MCTNQPDNGNTNDTQKGSDKVTDNNEAQASSASATPASMPQKRTVSQKTPAKKASTRPSVATRTRDMLAGAAGATQFIDERVDLKLSQEFAKFEELVARGTQPGFAIKRSHVKETEVRKVLHISDDVELTREVVQDALLEHAKATDERLNKVEKDVKHATSVADSAHAAVRELGNRVEEDHDTIVTNLLPRVAELEDLMTRDDLSEAFEAKSKDEFVRRLYDSGLTKDDVDKMLCITGDFGYTDPEMFAAFLNNYKARMSTAEQYIHNLQERVYDDIDPRLTRVEKRLDEGNKVSGLAIVVGAVTAVLSFIVMYILHGSFDGYPRDLGFAIFLALAIGLAATLVVGSTGSKRKEQSEESTSRPRRLGKLRSAWKGEEPNSKMLHDEPQPVRAQSATVVEERHEQTERQHNPA